MAQPGLGQGTQLGLARDKGHGSDQPGTRDTAQPCLDTAQPGQTSPGHGLDRSGTRDKAHPSKTTPGHGSDRAGHGSDRRGQPRTRPGPKTATSSPDTCGARRRSQYQGAGPRGCGQNWGCAAWAGRGQGRGQGRSSRAKDGADWAGPGADPGAGPGAGPGGACAVRSGESRWGGRGARRCWRPVRAGPELGVGEPRSGTRCCSRPRGHRPLPPLRRPRASGAGGEALPGSQARLPSERPGRQERARAGLAGQGPKQGPQMRAL